MHSVVMNANGLEQQKLASAGLAIAATDEISWPEVANGAAILVDVRSPKEFQENHIPGAVSVPLFDDRERATIGTLYKQEGPGVARRWGAGRVIGRLEAFTDDLLEALRLHPDASPHAPPAGDPPRVIVCARGGQRSGAVTQHLRGLGFPVYRLRGGYRSYRADVRSRLESARVPGPIVLNGLTGCAKTRVLRELDRQFPGHILDLEGLAGHRSSVLGDIGLQPVSQKQFEAQLLEAIEALDGRWCMVEWEARRVGNREIPSGLYAQLRAATQIELQATVEQRVDVLVGEYLACGGVAEVCRRLPALASYPAFGADGVAKMQQQLNDGEIAPVVRRLLETHYDPRYQHGNQHFDFARVFALTDPKTTAAEILQWVEEVV